MYTLIGTAKLNGVDPEARLRYVLAHIGDHRVNQVDNFLAVELREPGSVPPLRHGVSH